MSFNECVSVNVMYRWYCVQTRSSSEVASHTQKYFKRLASTKKESKLLSINDITTLKMQCCNGESSTAGTGKLLHGNLERAAVHAGT